MSIDKEALYGKFQGHQDKKNRLGLKAAHKALDIADDDMNITANKTTGIGTLGAIGIALAAGLPMAGVAGMLMMNQGNKATATSPAPTQIVQPIATQPVAPSAQPDGEFDEVLYNPADNGQPEKIISRTRYRWRSGVLEMKLSDGTWKKVN